MGLVDCLGKPSFRWRGVQRTLQDYGSFCWLCHLLLLVDCLIRSVGIVTAAFDAAHDASNDPSNNGGTAEAGNNNDGNQYCPSNANNVIKIEIQAVKLPFQQCAWTAFINTNAFVIAVRDFAVGHVAVKRSTTWVLLLDASQAIVRTEFG